MTDSSNPPQRFPLIYVTNALNEGAPKMAKPWTLPPHLEPFRPFFDTLPGADLETMMNDVIDFRHLPHQAIATAKVQGAVALLEWLDARGCLSRPEFILEDEKP